MGLRNICNVIPTQVLNAFSQFTTLLAHLETTRLVRYLCVNVDLPRTTSVAIRPPSFKLPVMHMNICIRTPWFVQSVCYSFSSSHKTWLVSSHCTNDGLLLSNPISPFTGVVANHAFVGGSHEQANKHPKMHCCSQIAMKNNTAYLINYLIQLVYILNHFS